MPHTHMIRRKAVGTITIDRPARFNSLDVTTARDFRRAGLQFARDDGVRVVVLRGLPTMFCSGADLKFIRDGGDLGGLGYLAPGAARAATANASSRSSSTSTAPSRRSGARRNRSSRRSTAWPRRADSGSRCRAISCSPRPGRASSGRIRRPGSRAPRARRSCCRA